MHNKQKFNTILNQHLYLELTNFSLDKNNIYITSTVYTKINNLFALFCSWRRQIQADIAKVKLFIT